MAEVENDVVDSPAAAVNPSSGAETKPKFKVNTANLMFRAVQPEPSQQPSTNSPGITSSSSSVSKPSGQVSMNKLTLTNRKSSPVTDSVSTVSVSGAQTSGTQSTAESKPKVPVEYTDEELTNKGISLAGRFRSSSDVNWEDEEDDWQPDLTLPSLPTKSLSLSGTDKSGAEKATDKVKTPLAPSSVSKSASTTSDTSSPAASVQTDAGLKPVEGTAWGTKKIVSASTSLADRIKEAKSKESGSQLPRGHQGVAHGVSAANSSQDAWNRFRIKSAVPLSVNHRGPPPLNPRMAAVDEDEPPTFRIGVGRDGDNGGYGGGFGRRDNSYHGRWQDHGGDDLSFLKRAPHNEGSFDFTRRIGPSDGSGVLSSPFGRGNSEFASGSVRNGHGLETHPSSTQPRKAIPARFLRPQAAAAATAASSEFKGDEPTDGPQPNGSGSIREEHLSSKRSEVKASDAVATEPNEPITISEPISLVQKEEMTSTLTAVKERLEAERKAELDKQQRLEEMRNKMRLEKLRKEEEEEAKRKSRLEYMSQRHAKIQEKAREMQLRAETEKENNTKLPKPAADQADESEQHQEPKVASWIAQKERLMASEAKNNARKYQQMSHWESNISAKVQPLGHANDHGYSSAGSKSNHTRISNGTNSVDVAKLLSQTKVLLPTTDNFSYSGGIEMSQLFTLGVPNELLYSKELTLDSKEGDLIPNITIRLPHADLSSSKQPCDHTSKESFDTRPYPTQPHSRSIPFQVN